MKLAQHPDPEIRELADRLHLIKVRRDELASIDSSDLSLCERRELRDLKDEAIDLKIEIRERLADYDLEMVS